MSFSWTFTSQVNAWQTTAVNDILNQVVQFMIDLLYTTVTIVINFISQPAVIGAMAGVGIIFMAYKKIKAKSMVG